MKEARAVLSLGTHAPLIDLQKQRLLRYEPGMMVDAAYAALVERQAMRDPSRAAKVGLLDRETTGDSILDQFLDEQAEKVGGTPPQVPMKPQSPGDAVFSRDFVSSAWEREGGTVQALQRLLNDARDAPLRQQLSPLAYGMRVGGVSPTLLVDGVSYRGECC